MSVYFAKGQRDGLVKIGKSNSPDRRLVALASAEKQPVTMLRVIEGGHAVEREMHQNFLALRVRGEWFRFDKSMMVIEASIQAMQKDADKQSKRAAQEAESNRKIGLLASRRTSLAELRASIEAEGSDRIKAAMLEAEARMEQEMPAWARWG